MVPKRWIYTATLALATYASAKATNQPELSTSDVAKQQQIPFSISDILLPAHTTQCKTGKDRPHCSDPNCSGDDRNLCTKPEQKGCACDILVPIIVDGVFPNKDWVREQQEFLEKILSEVGSVEEL